MCIGTAIAASQLITSLPSPRCAAAPPCFAGVLIVIFSLQLWPLGECGRGRPPHISSHTSSDRWCPVAPRAPTA